MWNVNCEDREKSQQASKIQADYRKADRHYSALSGTWALHIRRTTPLGLPVFFQTKDWGQVKLKAKGWRQVDENRMQPRAPQFKIMAIFCSAWQHRMQNVWLLSSIYLTKLSHKESVDPILWLRKEETISLLQSQNYIALKQCVSPGMMSELTLMFTVDRGLLFTEGNRKKNVLKVFNVFKVSLNLCQKWA